MVNERDQFGHAGERELADGGLSRSSEVGCRERDAQAHRVMIDDGHKTDAACRARQGKDFKSPPIQGMARIGDFDLAGLFQIWVLEGGIKLGDRSIISIRKNCSRCWS